MVVGRFQQLSWTDGIVISQPFTVTSQPITLIPVGILLIMFMVMEKISASM